MVDIVTFRNLALSFPGTEEAPHFDRVAFKVISRQIFASLLEKELSANIRLSLQDQSVYCSFDQKSVYPVPNKFGLQGWTTFNLNMLPVELVSDALLKAYQEALQSKPAKKKRK